MPVALLSVADKTGLIEFAQTITDRFGFQIVSSGGTAQVLQQADIPVTKVSDYTGAPEILGGRVKTLHPKIHGGILARLNIPQDLADLVKQDIPPIALVVVNLYPFQATIARENITEAEAIEQIDIGGPTLLRAAAKNFEYVTVLSNPNQYDRCLAEMTQNRGQTTQDFRRELAIGVFNHTQAYDRAIAEYLSGTKSFHVMGGSPKKLRYGENPHQAATWYQTDRNGWSESQLLQGKELSYNNLLDLEAARKIMAEFVTDAPCAVIVKHNNPCGVAQGENLLEAYQKAFAADAISAFGGIVALNRNLDREVSAELTKTFLECIVAPSATPEALETLANKPNLRVLLLQDFTQAPEYDLRPIAGGFLVQDPDCTPANTDTWQTVTDRAPTPELLAELLFAWKVCRHVKSNAIVVTAGKTTLGIGAGQMNRVGSVTIALNQAGSKCQGSVLASDGFFPFDDSVRTAAQAGIVAIVQPGGSLRDQDSIKAANELGIVMVFTQVRHFYH